MKKNLTTILLLAVILLVFVSSFNIIKKNDIENELISLKEDMKQSEKKVEADIETENEKDIETKEEKVDTLEEDIEWFVTEVYTIENRKELYESIKNSATEEVLVELFGEELPPDENQGEVHSIDRNIENLEVYGRYETENNYKAIVTFDLVFNHEDTAFTVMQVDITKKDDAWKVDSFEEYAKGEK